MKRSAFLIVGLSVLLPYLVGVVLATSTRASISTTSALLGRVVGAIPGFFAVEIPRGIGRGRRGAGGLPRAVARSTLRDVRVASAAAARAAAAGRRPAAKGERSATRRPRGEPGAGKAEAARAAPRTSPPSPSRATRRPPSRRPGPTASRARRRRPGSREPRRAPGEQELGPVWDVDLLEAPRTRGIDAGEGELDVLQERLEETLAEFKVEGDVAGADHRAGRDPVRRAPPARASR